MRSVTMPFDRLSESARVRKRHRNLFKCRIARALADAIDRAFDLARTGAHRGQSIRDSQAKIIVVMCGEDHAFGAPGTRVRSMVKIAKISSGTA